MTAPDIYLDAQIRSWVLVPITLAMFLIGVLRHLVQQLMKNNNVKVELKNVREAQCVLRAQRLRQNSGYLPPSKFSSKRLFFTHKDLGVLHEIKDQAPPNPLAAFGMGGGAGATPDPSQLVDMMKKNLSMVVPQIVQYNWVAFFFSGFVVAKVPFALTMRFRAMLQRGVDLNSLSVTYVSSLSWYFLNLFGLRGVFSIVLGENSIDDYANMQNQMQMGMQDAPKAYTMERENLELVSHTWHLPLVERHCIKMLQEKIATN
eukprot:CAMPEP_0196580964 /NCGR_PEP_ID=MMETSP1081-20130531/31752_1 /TAXON_ID=36882 /ORGANISM="Pyramimonas amylifera, Strain CCMP720" /LENGTH=259 /DNA_ID=CAMNT_0041901023 /DNA_START=60 /DNA_END=839 /DNA_ORIENTATION=-